MEKIFLHLLNMSLTAAVLVLVVLWLRVIFRRAPRWIHCLLWALVAVRLLCPFTIESDLSLMPDTEAAILAVTDTPATDGSGTTPPAMDTTVTDDPVAIPPATDTPAATPIPNESPTPNSSLSAPTPEASADPWQIALAVATYVWLAGVVVLAAYATVTTLRLRRKVGESAHLEGNLWHCDHIRSPFILGVFRPRIYLPSDLSGTARDSVIAHEQAHLHRRDHWWKPLGFLLLTVYWFNPLMWVAYVLLCRDIEAACDQRVVRDMSAADRKAYSEALLTCSAPRRLVSACPLAFGENSVKSRIKSVLSYKKPTVWIIVVALLVSTVAGVCLLTDPKSDTPVTNPDTQPSDTDMDTDPTDGIRYATFIHNGEPRAKVTLEIGGNRCTYINSTLSSAMPYEGTYEMGTTTVTLNFPDDAMKITFDGDLTELKLRIGMGSTKMSYEQMSYGDYMLTDGAVFARIADARRVSFAAPLTFSDMNWIEDERYTALCQHKYRNDHLSSEDLPILAIASRAELDAFIAEYTEDFSFNKAEGDGLTPTHQMSFYDDAFFAEKQLLAVYYRNGSCSMRPQISAVEYNGEELVTVSVDVYEPSMHQDALGQWFMLAEVSLAEIEGATAYCAVVRNRIPTDNCWATYSHPVTVGDTEPAVGKYRLEYDAPDTLRQLVERLDWYGADIMADTDFSAIAYFTFDGEKKYYLNSSLTTLYDGERIADLTDEDAESLDYLLRSGVPTDAATASVSGTVVEWSKEDNYVVLEVTDGDSKLGSRVKVYTGILLPGSAPAVGYSATIYYDGWYDGTAIYAIDRKWMDADLLGGPDDEPSDPTTTGSTTVTTKPSATESTSTTKPTTTTTAISSTSKVTFVKFSRPVEAPHEWYGPTQYMYPIEPDSATCNWLRQLAKRTNWVKKETYLGTYDAYFTIGEDEEYYYIDRVNRTVFHNRRFLLLSETEVNKLDALIRSCGIQLNSKITGTTMDWEYITGRVQECVGGMDGYVMLKVDFQWVWRYGETIKVSTRFIPHETFSPHKEVRVVYDGEIDANDTALPHTIYAASIDRMKENEIIPTGVGLYDELLKQMQTYFYDRTAVKPNCSDLVWGLESLSEVGIALVDLDKNGQNELVIGAANPIFWKGYYNAYTIENGKLVQLFSANSKMDYYLCRNGNVCEEWTNTRSKHGQNFYRIKGGQLIPLASWTFNSDYAYSIGLPSEDAWFRVTTRNGEDIYEQITEEETAQMAIGYGRDDITYHINVIPFSL